MSVDTPAWVRDAVFYQVFPDRFAASERVPKPGALEPWDSPPSTHGFKGGDLLGVAERLPYLADLGVNALYLTPVFQSASNHRYHTFDYFHVDPLLGGDAALRELLDRHVDPEAWGPDDVVITNDPYCGGQHLPDQRLRHGERFLHGARF